MRFMVPTMVRQAHHEILSLSKGKCHLELIASNDTMPHFGRMHPFGASRITNWLCNILCFIRTR
jgi:hypothetical protein